MPTERTPLRHGDSIPPYVFITSSHRSYKNKVRKFQCCICAGILAIFITALVITISYTVNHDDEDNNVTTTVPPSTTTTASPVNDSTLVSLLALNWPIKDKPYPKWNKTSNATEIESALDAGKVSLKLKEAFEEDVPTLLLTSPSYRHQMATRTMPRARELSKYGHIMEAATKELLKKRPKSDRSVGRSPEMKIEWLPKEVCSENVESSCQPTAYRSADGSCNNKNHPRTWGVAMRPFRRVLPPAYADGISAPRKGKDGDSLPSAREVSTIIHRPLYRDDPNFTVMLAVWGQFIDHDITATALSQGKEGKAISCCYKHYQSGLKSHPECYTVSISSPDPYYDVYNVSCMEFVRSSPSPTCSFGPREQMNQASGFLDGSVVYGTTDDLITQLRTLQGGELKMLITPDGQELLPVSVDSNDGCNQEDELANGRYCFLSGDPRSNENIHLTTIHLLFARQHNLIARNLSQINPEWDDEKLFQESRKIVAAQIQHITYNEFLPVILGPRLLAKLQMNPRSKGYSNTYDETLDPSIANSFASSAFRFGHTLLPGLVRLIAGDNSSEEYVEMHKMLFNPFHLYDKGFIEKAVRGAVNTPVEKVDTYFNAEFTEHLFERKPSVGLPKGMCGLDLVSLNVQRGRDHGLPAYPEWREHCGLPRPKNFDDMKNFTDLDSLYRLKKMYKTIDDVDMYTGALAEIPLEGSLVGPTVTCLLTDQFLRLQRGDRYWYETPEQPQAFTEEQLSSLRQTSLAKILCDTSNVETIQPRVMQGKAPDNDRQLCSDIPAVDLSLWKEKASVPVGPTAGKVWFLKNSAPNTPSTLKVMGNVHSVTTKNDSLWDNTLPMKIPTTTLDSIAEYIESTSLLNPPVFASGITWLGSFSASSGLAHIEGKMNVPIVDNGSVRWYNDYLFIDLSVSWTSTTQDSINISGSFLTPLYYTGVAELSYLKNSILTDLKLKSTLTKGQTLNKSPKVAPVIMMGAFSDDNQYFMWNGNVTFFLPIIKEKTKISPNTYKLMAYTPKIKSNNLKISGGIKDGFASIGGYVLWNGSLPVEIPVNSYGTLNDAEDGRGILWSGIVLSTGSKTASISANFSLPHLSPSKGISPFALQWYNGDLTLNFDVSWSSAPDNTFSINGNFISPVYLSERPQYDYLKNTSVVKAVINSSLEYAGTPKIYSDLKAPLVLLGAYSDDLKAFYWNGNFSISLPQLSSTQTLKKKSQTPSPISDCFSKTSLRLVGGQVNVGGWNVWYNNLPLALPVDSFGGVAFDSSDQISKEPPVYGHAILWNATASKIDENFVKIQGNFSFPFQSQNLSWINGNFALDFQVNETLSISDSFASRVYFIERTLFETLEDSTHMAHLDNLSTLGIASTGGPEILINETSIAPLIIYGAFSLDKTEFLWSGNCALFLPNNSKPSAALILETKSEESPLRLKGKVDEMLVGDVKLGVKKSPIAIPTKYLASVRTAMSASDTPPAYSQGVIWTGKVETINSSKIIQISGTYSIPIANKTGVSWFNGKYALSVKTKWVSSSVNISGTFYSPIYLKQKRSGNKMKVQETPSISFEISSDPTITSVNLENAPIELLGSFSEDGEIFLWSGDLTLILPLDSALKKAETMFPALQKVPVTAFVSGGSITLSGESIWVGNRVPLTIPFQTFYPVVSIFDESINRPSGHDFGILWKGFITTDSPGMFKLWGTYSLPHRYNASYVEWFNGDFAFQLKLLDSTNLHPPFQGTYLTDIYLKGEKTDLSTESDWALISDIQSSNSSNILSTDVNSFIPVILYGSFSKNQTSFYWSGNVTLFIDDTLDTEVLNKS